MRAISSILLVAVLIAIGVFAHIGYQHFFPEEKQSGRGGWGGRNDKHSAAATASRSGTPVEVAKVILKDVRTRVPGSGVLEADRDVTVLAQVAGEVEAISFEEGDSVEEGQVLCTIDERALAIAAQVSRVQMDFAVVEFERLNDLRTQASSAVSPRELEQLRVEKERTHALHDQALLDLTHAKPQIPFTGVVVKRHVEKGQHVRPGDPLFDVSDFTPLKLRLRLPQNRLAGIQTGLSVELRRDQDSDAIATGTVERIGRVVSRDSLTVEVLTVFASVPDDLRPGSFARVEIIVDTLRDVLLVPRSAVIRVEGRSHLFRVTKDGKKAERVDIETGYEDDRLVQVVKGITAGERVVVTGNRELGNGDAVKIFREIPTSEK